MTFGPGPFDGDADLDGTAEVAFAARTAPEIRAVGERDGSVLVLPVGSVEQHGDHLPVATDSILASAVAAAGAAAVVDDVPVLVAPTFWTGYSPHHRAFGGTLTGEFDTLLDLLGTVADAALDNGFDALLLLNGHGGNRALVDAAVTVVGRAHPDAESLGLTYFDLAAPFADEIRESDTGGMAHGGEFETSLMQYLRPELVREDAPATYWVEPYDLAGNDLLEGGPLSVYRPFEAYSESGAIGDPSLADADKGERFFDGIRAELAALLLDVHERNAV
ncbi:creatininase family protein [Haloprofundus salinisoli]|uniref:creatininase family protein n=1 Tax=Haloprofundus salinisoli TaxID=2876193 RepID=UPI001CCF5E75|nr:creatininase family protein [Haloprofundus salinisoli]